MHARAPRRYRRHKLAAVVACTLTLFGAGTGGATADPAALPVAPADLAEPLAWANPAARAPGGSGVSPQVTRIALGDFHRPAPGVSAQGGTLSDVPLAEGYRRTRQTRTLTTTRTTTGRFSAVGVTWRETTGTGAVGVAVRHHVPGGAKSTWQTVGAGETDRDAGEGAPARRGGADLLWVGPSDGVQISVTAVSGAAPHDVAADLIDPAEAPGDAQPPPPVTEAAPGGLRPFMPAINRRAAWGANERQMDWRPQYAPHVKAAAVHHTATSNAYSEADVPKILRSIYQFQTVSRGWGDIGYNVLVDRFGRLWEGRSGGLAWPVVGAQAGGFNTGTAGIAMIGDYRATTPIFTSGPNEIAVPADYNGDGKVDVATWSPTTQEFTVEGRAPVRLGDPGDTPVPGQYDGDGHADLAVFHDGRFEIRGVGRYDVGSPGDIPMPLG